MSKFLMEILLLLFVVVDYFCQKQPFCFVFDIQTNNCLSSVTHQATAGSDFSFERPTERVDQIKNQSATTLLNTLIPCCVCWLPFTNG